MRGTLLVGGGRRRKRRKEESAGEADLIPNRPTTALPGYLKYREILKRVIFLRTALPVADPEIAKRDVQYKTVLKAAGGETPGLNEF